MKKVSLIIIIILFLIGIGTRIITYRELSKSPLLHAPILDGKYYHARAIEILHENWIGDKPFFMSPLYPYFLSMIYLVFSPDPQVTRIVQHVTGIFTMVMFYILASKILSRRGSIIALSMFAGYPVFIFFETQLLHATILTFLLVCLTILLIINRVSPRPYNFLLTGILVGLLATGRGVFLLLLPAVMAITWFQENTRKNVKLALYILAGVALVILPITLRNYVVSNEFTLITTNGGLNFYIGNNPMSEGGYVMLDQIEAERDPTGRNYVNMKTNKSLSDKEVSAYWRSLAITEIRKNPLHYLKLYLKKIHMYFSGYEIPQLENFFYYCHIITPVLGYLPVLFSIISPLAVMGMILGIRKNPDLKILFILIIVQALGISVFFISGRYRLPAVPLFIIFSAYTLERIIDYLVTKKWINCITVLTVILGLFLALNLKHPEQLDFSIMEYNLGVISKDRGDYKQALQHFSRVDPGSKAYGESLYASGICYQYAGFPEQARDVYLQAAETFPQRPEIAYNLGTVYESLNQFEKAVKSYKRSLELAPHHFRSYHNIGNIYQKTGKLDLAIKYFRKAIEINEWYLRAYLNLGKTYYMQGNIDTAADIFQDVINRFPDQPEGYQNYGIMLVELGDVDKAIEIINTALRINPDSKTLNLLLDRIKREFPQE